MSSVTVNTWDNFEELSEKLEVLSEIQDYQNCSPDFPLLNQMTHHYLFVYDSMKSRLRNHRDIEDFPMVGLGTTKNHFQMYIEPSAIGSDALIMFTKQWDTPAAPVYGEIYKVPPSVIRDLDWHESNQFITTRVKLPINAVVDQTGNPRQIYAWCYVHRYSYWESRPDRIRTIKTMKPAEGPDYYNFIRPLQDITSKAYV